LVIVNKEKTLRAFLQECSSLQEDHLGSLGRGDPDVLATGRTVVTRYRSNCLGLQGKCIETSIRLCNTEAGMTPPNNQSRGVWVNFSRASMTCQLASYVAFENLLIKRAMLQNLGHISLVLIWRVLCERVCSLVDVITSQAMFTQKLYVVEGLPSAG
jgi:hypothetical protein